MSRLAEVLGVKEGQPFRFEGCNSTYKIENGKRWYLMSNNIWDNCAAEVDLIKMINHPEQIHPIPQYTEQQLTAFRGRIAEGTPWVAQDKDMEEIGVDFFVDKPFINGDGMYDDGSSQIVQSGSPLYDFVTFENSPIDLREIVKEAEECSN